MADLYYDSHRLQQIVDCDEVDTMGAQRARIEIFLLTYYNLSSISLDLDHVEGRARGHAQPLALPYGEVVDAAVLANHLPVAGDQFSRRVGQSVALLGQ